MTLWLAPKPLLFASRSAIRRTLLEAAGIPVEVRTTDVDERAVEAAANPRTAADAALLLAQEKALTAAAATPGRLVLGADQTLALGNERLTKPGSRDAARAQLEALSGRTHELQSAVAVVRDEVVLFAHVAVATLTMRPLSPGFLDRYLDAAGSAVTTSVGGYQLEGLGIHLFERIEGDHFTILGLPLLPLLVFLRREGLLAG